MTAPAAVLAVAFVSRVMAGRVLQSFVDRLRPARLCVFPDTNYYWLLARTIREGRVYEIVEWGTNSHKALRTPGYPLFLAACQAVAGESTLGVRMVQAVLGTASVWLIYELTRQFEGNSTSETGGGTVNRTAAVAAATLAAINPYYIAFSELLLSEALFIPLLLASLWALAVLWRAPGEADRLTLPRRVSISLAAGGAGGAAVLVKPSFALFLPGALLCWLVALGASRDRLLLKHAVQGALFVTLGFSLTMSPWWVRNARTYGQFVPTSIWLGASLYDGLNPSATGASDMRFRDAPEFRVLSEVEQDRVLRRQALEFVRGNPGRTLGLAVIKLGRYWSPWPNADEFFSPALAAASAAIVIPVYCLIIVGAWNRRCDLRAMVLLAGPLVYFCAVHLVFVSSIRYRIPGEMAAAALAGIGFQSIVRRFSAGCLSVDG
jgi:4-amino-4-deoxy-L-arabinose transferase-like glycosyltransferase